MPDLMPASKENFVAPLTSPPAAQAQTPAKPAVEPPKDDFVAVPTLPSKLDVPKSPLATQTTVTVDSHPQWHAFEAYVSREIGELKKSAKDLTHSSTWREIGQVMSQGIEKFWANHFRHSTEVPQVELKEAPVEPKKP